MIDSHDIQRWLNGEILRSGRIRKHYKLLGLIAALTFIYILGGYHAMQQHHRLTDLKNEVKDAKYEYLTISAEKLESTRQSQIALKLEEKGSGIKQAKKPAVQVK